jgi:hypothetical protein
MKTTVALIVALSLVLASLALFGSGCDHGTASKTVRVDVARVFQQQPGSYSFLVREGNELVSRNEYNYRLRPDVKTIVSVSHLLTDAPEGKPMFVEFEYHYAGDWQETCEIKIHVHSSMDVDATGYEIAGKHPVQVQPKVIE